jgi:soluble lytic murein transglycosylase
MEPLNMRNLSTKSFPRKALHGKNTVSARLKGCKKTVLRLWMLVILLPSLPAGAATNAQVVQAVQAMKRDEWTLARRLIGDSHDSIGQKLYFWMYFREDKGDFNFSTLAQFVKNHPHWPDMDELREKAERNMPYGLAADEIISWFDNYPPLTAAGVDRYIEALLIKGQKDKAKKTLTEWWAEKLTTRDEQRTIYYKYGQMIDMDAHRRRLDTLLFSKQYTNARGIAQVLELGFPELTEARIALAEEKPGASGLISKVPANLQNDPGLLYERLRWRRRNDMDMDAVKILHNHPPAGKISNPEDWWKEQHIIIRRLLEKRMYESAYLLASKHFQTSGASYADAEWMAGWMALRFMKNPAQAYQRFEALYGKVETPISKARAAYWAGRAAEAMKQSELSNSWYQKAAKFQTVFYGQLAGAKLGMAQSLPNAAPPVLTQQDIDKFSGDDLIRAARIFNQADMDKEAANFLEAFVEHKKSPKAYRYGAELAAKLGYYRDGVKIAKDATKEGMFLTAQAFPVITEKLRNIDTEWALVHAIIRQESMFDQEAASPAGALGLMQLMPGTAKETAHKIGQPYNRQALTSNPDYNIRLGSAYMNQLLNRYDGSYPLAIAAYNGGPGRVSEALQTFGDPRTGQIDLIDWMELIPVPETRNYVQRVLEGVYVYRLRLKGVQKPPTHEIHIAMAQHPRNSTSVPRATR